MGIINTGFIAGLLALGIPIIIHLLLSKRFKKADLGTIRFLKLTLQESSRWRKLRDWLLLLTRLAIIALLVYLFARPFLHIAEVEQQKDMEALFLLDTSGSMNCKTDNKQNLEIAIKKIKKISKKLPENTKITVATFSDDIKLLPSWKNNKITTGGATNYKNAMTWSLNYLNKSTMPNRKIFLITDLQRNGLPKKAITDWPLDLPVETIPIPPAGKWNIAITQVHNQVPFLSKNGNIEFYLQLYGEAPEDDIELMVEIDGVKERFMQQFPLRSGPVNIKWTPKKAGLCTGTATLMSSDGYPLDNKRHFAFYIRTPHPVLLVDGEPGSNRFQSETYFLNKLLSVTERQNTTSPFLPEIRTTLGDLQTKHVVTLCNVAYLSNKEIAQLSKFVANGGNLIYFLGDQANQQLYSKLHKAGIFPGTITAGNLSEKHHIDTWDKTHPILKLFKNREYGDLSRIIFDTSIQLKPDKNCKLLATLDNNCPAIIESKYQKGTIITITNPSDRELTKWVTEPIFLPLAREIYTYLSIDMQTYRPIIYKNQSINETRKIGVYQNNKIIEVVTTNNDEANIITTTKDKFCKQLGIGDSSQESKINNKNAPKERQRSNEIWIYLLFAILLLMILESILTDRGEA